MPKGGDGPGNSPGAQSALIVDDDVVCRLFCRQILASTGYKVLECCDAADAIAHSVRFHPAVILLDLRLRGSTGCHVAADILRTWPAAHAKSCLVGMTADPAEPAHAEFLRAGCSAVMLKPFGAAELLSVIARVSPGMQPPHEPALQTAFLRELRRQLPALDRAVTYLDWNEAEQVLHRISGAAALAGFGSLSREARALLVQVRQQDDGLCLVEHYLELLAEAAALLRQSTGAGDVVLSRT